MTVENKADHKNNDPVCFTRLDANQRNSSFRVSFVFVCFQGGTHPLRAWTDYLDLGLRNQTFSKVVLANGFHGTHACMRFDVLTV